MGSTQISVRWLLRRKTKDKEGLQYPGKKFLVRDRFFCCCTDYSFHVLKLLNAQIQR